MIGYLAFSSSSHSQYSLVCALWLELSVWLLSGCWFCSSNFNAYIDMIYLMTRCTICIIRENKRMINTNSDIMNASFLLHSWSTLKMKKQVVTLQVEMLHIFCWFHNFIVRGIIFSSIKFIFKLKYLLLWLWKWSGIKISEPLASNLN